MSTSNPTGFPQGPSIGGKAPKGAESQSPLKAQIIGVPNEARGAEQTTRIRGIVTRNDNQGNIRVRTENGNIDLQLSKAEVKASSALQKGQYVEIEIPPERRERPAAGTERRELQTREIKIRVRSAPAQSQQAQSAQTQNTQQQRELAPPAEQTAPRQTADFPNTPLPPAPVRLEPLPQDLMEQVTLPAVQKIEARLDIIVQNAVQQQAAALNTLSSPAQQPQQTSLPQTVQSALPLTNPQPPTLVQEGVILQNAQPAQRPIALIPLPSPGALATQNNFVQATQLGNGMPVLIGSSFPLSQPIPLKVQPVTVPLASIQTEIGPQTLPTSLGDPASPRGLLVPPLTLPDSLNSVLIQSLKLPPVQMIAPDQAIKPPNIQNPPASNLRIGDAQAVLSGVTPNNLPVLSFTNLAAVPIFSSGAPQFILHHPLPGLPAGTEIILQIQGTQPMMQASGVSPQSLQSHAMTYALPPAPSYFLSPEMWPVMTDALQTLNAQSAQVAQAMQAVSPSPSSPAQIGPAALFFIAAIKGGDIQSWLGEKATEMIRKAGRGDILNRLSAETSTLSRMAREAPPGEWRGMSIPLAHDAQIEKVVFHYKHDYPDGDESDPGEKRTRFIFDLNLSQMGMVQLDGMHQGRRLDMVLRTQDKFSEPVRMHMKQLYHQALELESLHGDLNFHSRPDQWVKVPLKHEGEHINI